MPRTKFPFFIVQLAVSLVLFGFLLLQIHPWAFFQALLKIKIGYLLIGLVLFPLGQLVSVIKWRYLARPLGIHQDFKPMAGLYFIGTFFNFVLPTMIGGDITRSLYLTPDADKTRISFLSVLVERGSGVVSHLILASIVLLTPFGSSLPQWLRYGFPLVSLLALIFFALLPVLVREDEDSFAGDCLPGSDRVLAQTLDWCCRRFVLDAVSHGPRDDSHLCNSSSLFVDSSAISLHYCFAGKPGCSPAEF